MPFALAFALAKAGKSNPASRAMMAITTSNSMSVNAAFGFGFISLQFSILHPSFGRVCRGCWLFDLASDYFLLGRKPIDA